MHGCTNCSNLEMDPKYLAKSDVQLNPKSWEQKMLKGCCKKHQNNESLEIVMVYHVSNSYLEISLFCEF